MSNIKLRATCISYVFVNKDLTLKAKAKDLTSRTGSRTALGKLSYLTVIVQNETENSNLLKFKLQPLFFLLTYFKIIQLQ